MGYSNEFFFFCLKNEKFIEMVRLMSVHVVSVSEQHTESGGFRIIRRLCGSVVGHIYWGCGHLK